MLSSHADYHDPCRGIDELREKFDQQEHDQREKSKVVLRSAAQCRSSDQCYRRPEQGARAPKWPAIRSAHISLRDDDDSSDSDWERRSVHHKPWKTVDEAFQMRRPLRPTSRAISRPSLTCRRCSSSGSPRTTTCSHGT